MPTGAAGATAHRIIGVQGRPPNILVVDDIADNRAVLVRQLAPLGFALAEAATAAEGMSRAVAFNPEVLIVDLMLSDSSGLELIQHLRQHATLKTTVIIVSSASVFAEDRHNSLAAGADDFLPKPVKTEQLLEMLQRHLDLEWRYAEEQVPAHRYETNGTAPALPAVSLPPPEELARLYELVQMGDAAALQNAAAALCQADEQLAPFAGEVERRARRLQMNELSAFLEQYRER
jgi:CheY-like chemotaxis protein